MSEPVQKVLAELERARARFLDTISGWDDAQLAFRPRASSWSALEVAEHVLIAEQVSIDTMLRLAGRRSKARTLVQKLGYALVWLILKLKIRVSSPARVTNPTGSMTLREIRADWEVARRRLREHLSSLETEGLREAGFAHPVAGPLTLQEGLRYLERHLRHHQAQLERIRRHSRFPQKQAVLSAGAS